MMWTDGTSYYWRKALNESVKQPMEDVVEPDDALPVAILEELPALLQKAACRAGWSELMPVQAKAIPYLLARRDLMIQSRTGSGKTGAFILPILERIDSKILGCQALVLVPTRELARQVTTHAEQLSGQDGIRPVAVYGGVAYGPQVDAFERGYPLVVGTPGRILDHLLKKTLTLEQLQVLVFDEADRMLSMGFYPDMKRLQQHLPSHPINGYMFSATYPAHVMSLAGEFLRRPDFLSLSRDRVHVAETEHVFYDVPTMDKDRILVRIIEIENPASAIIFCNTKADVRYVSIVLQRFGYDADELSADLSQAARESVLERVRHGRLRFLVATDVAARGIDIIELSHVIQYSPPDDAEAYIHRVGRTGRAGAGGEAFTLASGLERIQLLNIAKRFEIDLLEREAPTNEEVQGIVSQRVTTLLESRLRDRDALQQERMQCFAPLARNLGQGGDGVRFIAMLLDDYYQETLHGPSGLPAIQTVKTALEVQEISSQQVRAELQNQLSNRDRLQQERMQRFIPLARSLEQETGEVDVIAMLLDDHYQETHQPRTGKPTISALKTTAKRPRRQLRSRRRKGRRRR